MNLQSQIQEFYGKIKFPGPYSIDDFEIYKDGLFNPFLNQYEKGIKNSKNILDIGCGSGMIVNLLAYRNPSIQFDALDFSDSIDYAIEFKNKHNIQNVNFHKVNFFEYIAQDKYDCIICNGVLHHMPEYTKAVIQINQLLKETGQLVVGLYNPYGKLAKKFFPVEYVNQTLFLDQEAVPFELTFSHQQVKELFNQYQLVDVYPGINKKFVDLINLFNYTNGGLTIYTFKKSAVL
jgi:2-polyprenyl-3-methyl-5-hydroxy-6-metoxy-1,4-benzoquinol methylase